MGGGEDYMLFSVKQNEPNKPYGSMFVPGVRESTGKCTGGKVLIEEPRFKSTLALHSLKNLWSVDSVL